MDSPYYSPGPARGYTRVIIGYRSTGGGGWHRSRAQAEREVRASAYGWGERVVDDAQYVRSDAAADFAARYGAQS